MTPPRLQSFDFRSSPYERPTQTWICGRVANGQPCLRGPDGKGKCRTTSECRPRRSGESWLCTRPANVGGACADGPTPDGRCCRSLPPCVPIRSLRSRRGWATGWATLLSLAVLMLMFGGSMSPDLIHPGPVITGHAEIKDCGSCHVAFEGGPMAWVGAAFRPTDAEADSRKCLACHDKQETGLNPHNLAHDALQTVSQEVISENPDSRPPWAFKVSRIAFPTPGPAAHGPLACATCHKEHEGELFDAVEVSNDRCQSCHKVSFHAFADGHPSFGNYPYLRRTRVVFDHDSHNRKNFAEEAKKGTKVPETCVTCHYPDATGRNMLVAPFEQTCGACHNHDIRGDSVAGVKGVAVIALPELDVDTLRDRGVAIGEWPEFAQAPEVSPFTKLLLAGSPGAPEDLAAVDELDLLDLSDASDEQLAAVARVAWGIKELLFDLAISGMGVLESKVEASLNHALDTDTVGRLVGHVPQDVLTAAAQAWFQNLDIEVTRYREQKAAGRPVDEIRGQSGGDTLSDSQLLNLDDDTVSPDDELLQLDETGAPDGDVKVGAPPAAAAPAPEAPAAAAGPAAEPAPADPAPVASEPPAAAPAALQIPRPLPKPAYGSPDAAVDALRQELDLPTLDPEDWAKAGGWFRKDFTLFYRPVEHEDSFVRTWLDIGANAYGTPAERYGEALFTLLSDKNTPGKCTKCHSVDRMPGGTLAVNWTPFRPTPGTTQFTMFVHETHFSAIGDRGCVACHQLNPSSGYQDFFKGQDPLSFASNFKPMQRETCAECHVPQSAGDSCTMCHQYHIGEFGAATLSTRMTDLDAGQPEEAPAATPPAEAAPAEPAPPPAPGQQDVQVEQPAPEQQVATRSLRRSDNAKAEVLPAEDDGDAEGGLLTRVPRLLANLLAMLAPGSSQELPRQLPDLVTPRALEPEKNPDADPLSSPSL
jgi:hypothetical protein